MAGVVGKLETVIEAKSKADKFWSAIRNFATIFPKASPSDYKSIQIIEGDGKTPGSAMKVTLDMGHELVSTAIERIEDVDDEKKILIYSVIDGDLLKYLKSYMGYISVTPKEDDNGSIVKWICDYETVSQEVPEPIFIKEFATKIFSKVDDYLQSE